MRLNFSGVSEAQIHEGIRRIGEIVHEQVALYGTLTGAAAPAPVAGREASAPVAPDAPGARTAPARVAGDPGTRAPSNVLPLSAQRRRA
jgi:2-aminoadipate transaminase